MFKKGKKDKKNKEKSSFFSSNSSIEYGYAQTNPKSKWAKWIIAGLVAGVTVVGITVPWALSSCTVKMSQPYSDGKIMYYYYNPITGEKVNVTYEEFENRVNNIQITNNIFDKWDDVFYKNVLEKYYNEEKEAFNKFKAIYDVIHKDDKNKVDSTQFGADLSKTFEAIESEQRIVLNENKRIFQKSQGNDWEVQWINELQTNSIYGPQVAEKGSTNVSLLENKAIDYMVTQQIKSSALARFNNFSITTDKWNMYDLNFVTGAFHPDDFKNVKCKIYNKTTKKWDDDYITYSEALEIWQKYLSYNDNNEFDNTKGINVIRPNNLNSDNQNTFAVYESNSFIPEYRNPIATDELITRINENYKFNLISSISLTSITPGSSGQDHFNFSKDTFKSFFTLTNVHSSGELINFVPFSQLSKFKGANLVNTSKNDKDVNSTLFQNKKDNLLIKSLNSDAAENLGSSKLVETSSLITQSSSDSSSDNSSIDMFYLSALTSSNEGYNSLDPSDTLFSINQNNPFQIFMDILFTLDNSTGQFDFSQYSWVGKNWENLHYNDMSIGNNSSLIGLVDFLKSNLNSDFTFKNSINAITYNNQLNEWINTLGDGETIMGRLLNCVLIGDIENGPKYNYDSTIFPNQVGYWTLYQLDAPTANNNNIGTYLYVSNSGMQIFSKSIVSNPDYETIKKMVYNDLIQHIDINDEADKNYYYETTQYFGKLNNDNLIITHLLEDDDNVVIFKQAIMDADGEISETDAEYIINNFNDYVKLQFNISNNESIYKIISNISSTLTNAIDSNRAYDFATIIDNTTKEKLVAFQTQTNFNEQSIAKSMDVINDLFIVNLQKILSVDTNVVTRKGGK